MNEAISLVEYLGHQRTTQERNAVRRNGKKRKRKNTLKFVQHYNSAVCAKLPGSYVPGVSVGCFCFSCWCQETPNKMTKVQVLRDSLINKLYSVINTDLLINGRPTA